MYDQPYTSVLLNMAVSREAGLLLQGLCFVATMLGSPNGQGRKRDLACSSASMRLDEEKDGFYQQQQQQHTSNINTQTFLGHSIQNKHFTGFDSQVKKKQFVQSSRFR